MNQGTATRLHAVKGRSRECTICSLSAITGLPTDTWPDTEHMWEYTTDECGGMCQLGTDFSWALCDINEFPEKYGTGVYLVALRHAQERMLELVNKGLPAAAHCIALEVLPDGSAWYADNNIRQPTALSTYMGMTRVGPNPMPSFADQTHRIGAVVLDSPDLHAVCKRCGARVESESNERAYRLIEEQGSIAAAVRASQIVGRRALRARALSHAEANGLPLPWRARSQSSRRLLRR